MTSLLSWNKHCLDHDTSVQLPIALPLLIEHKIIIVKIVLRVFLSLTLLGLEQKINGVVDGR